MEGHSMIVWDRRLKRTKFSVSLAVGKEPCNEYFCAVCLKPHRKQSLSKHQIILEGDHMPRPQMSQIQLDPCSEPCNQHTNEIVKFHSSSHDTLGCSDCMVLEHKACKVDRIQDISSNYCSSQEHRILVGKVGKFLDDLDKLKHEVHRNKQNISEMCNKAVNDIKTFRKDVNDYLDKAEAEILTEVKKRKQIDEKMMAKLEVDKQLLQCEIKEFEEKLDQQSIKANELFVVAKKMKEKMLPLNATLKQMFEDSRGMQYRFEPSSEVRQVIASEVPIGNLTENLVKSRPQKVKIVASQHVPIGKLKVNVNQSSTKNKIVDMLPQFECEINVRAPEEKRSCFLIASAIIAPTLIVLVDHNNKCVKLVDLGQRKLLARYGFNTYPTDVARISENIVAVTLPKEQKIQFLSITQKNKFTLEREMKMNCECKRLSCVQDKIIIACVGKLKILMINGNGVKEIIFLNLTCPKGIAPSHDCKSFFVSGGKPTAIYNFNFDGSVVATYTDKNLSSVKGLTVTRDGTMLVCNVSVPGSMHVVSPECKETKEILQHNEHVREPLCVSYCDETNKLFVCNHLVLGSREKLNDVVKIFQIYSYTEYTHFL